MFRQGDGCTGSLGSASRSGRKMELGGDVAVVDEEEMMMGCCVREMEL